MLFQIYTDADFEKQKMSPLMENKFIDYLIQIQQAMSKLALSNATDMKFDTNYIARGMGLIAGDEKRKNTFFIYGNSTFNENDRIFISIRGPYNSYGRTNIQSFKNDVTIDNTQLNNKKKENGNVKFFKAFSFGSLMYNNKKQGKHEIPIKIEIESHRAKVTFIPPNAGVYEICLITNGTHLVGSPYNVQILENLSDIIDEFTEDDKDTQPVTNIIKKRIISRTINFVDEQISYEQYENYKKSCMEKMIKEHEKLVETERRNSSILEDFKNINLVNKTTNNETEINFEEYEIISSNDINIKNESSLEKLSDIDKDVIETNEVIKTNSVEQLKIKYEYIQNNNNKKLSSDTDSSSIKSPSSEEIRQELQLKKQNFLNSTLSIALQSDDNQDLNNNYSQVDINVQLKETLVNEFTSPICNDHIEQEVQFEQNNNNLSFPHPMMDVKRTLEEKRKNFKEAHRLSNIQNEISFKETSSFNSEKTSDNSSICSDDNNRMRILSVLECLKRDNSYNYVTTSLPNLSNNKDVLLDNYRIRSNSLDITEISSIRMAYKERKAYWMKLLEDHKNISELNNYRNKKFMTLPNKIKLNCTFSYSANDVSHAKEKSSNTEYENLIFPSIQERKAIFASESNINVKNQYKTELDNICSNGKLFDKFYFTVFFQLFHFFFLQLINY